MSNSQINLVLISGPVGVGKTTVAEELSHLLEVESVAHTLIDLDGLAKTYPRQPDDPFGQQIALANLTAVWANAAKRGVRNLIIARVIETRDGAQSIERAVGASKSLIVQLHASDDVLIERVREREVGAGRQWHENRAIELSKQLATANIADHHIETDHRSVGDIAMDVFDRIEWF